MSRYTITVTSDGSSDPDAVIGYDPPLRTFFLQAFPDEAATTLLCGSARATAKTVDALHAAALSRGYSFMPLPADVAEQLADDLSREANRPPHDGPLAALLRHLQSK